MSQIYAKLRCLFINDQVLWDAQVADLKTAMEGLSNVEEVEVTKHEWTDTTGFDYYRWTVGITFYLGGQKTDVSPRNIQAKAKFV